MSWKDVPMPRQIAALPQDRRGFPVPWISDWDTGDENSSGWKIRQHTRYGAYAGECDHVDGVGVPNLGKLCAPRQISGMLERRCDVCGDHMPKQLYWMGNESLVQTGYNELPLHLECALYAGQVCPGLVTRAEGKIWVARSDTYRLLPVRKFRDGDRTMNSLDDDRWRLWDAVGMKSVMVSLLAVPEENVESWPLEEFLAMHGKQHPYRKVNA